MTDAERERRARVTADPGTDVGTAPVVVSGSDGEMEWRARGAARVRAPDGSVVAATIASQPPVGPDRAPGVEVVVDGWRFVFRVEDARRAELRERATRGGSALAAAGPVEVRTPIAGRIISVGVAAGDAVELGQPLLVVEAMKMQNEIRSPRPGVVRRVDVEAGRPVDAGDILLVVE